MEEIVLTEIKKWTNRCYLFNLTVKDITDEIKKQKLDIKDLNSWFQVNIGIIFYLLCQEILDKRKDLKEKVKMLKQNFNPLITEYGCFFNNIFDRIDWNNTKENVIEQAIELLEKT